MKVCWDDIGRSQVAGTYPILNTKVVVSEADIKVWCEYPSAIFNTTWYKRGQIIGSKALAGWSMPPAPSVQTPSRATDA